MPPNDRVTSTAALTATTTGDGFIRIGSETIAYSSIEGTINPSGSYHIIKPNKITGLHPQLYFHFVKSKFKVLQQMSLKRRIAKVEKAFNDAMNAGQYLLAEKFLKSVSLATRESEMYARGIKYFVEHEDLNRFKHSIRKGHISDTPLEKYTLVIPKDVQAKKKQVEDLFDGFVIYHYFNPEVEAKRDSESSMKATPEEKSAMRDPIIFGRIKESTKLYFIADWEDEHCDLTFDEIIDYLGKDEDHYKIPKNPVLETDTK